MTQPSKLFDLWRRLYTRFSIEPFPATGEGPAVGTTIIPITDADALLTAPLATSDSLDLSASAGAFVLAQTVPAGKRWTLMWLFRSATVANSRVRAVVTPAAIGLGLTLQATSLEIPEFITGIVFEQGDTIGMETTGNVGDDAVTLQLYLLEEDAF